MTISREYFIHYRYLLASTPGVELYVTPFSELPWNPQPLYRPTSLPNIFESSLSYVTVAYQGNKFAILVLCMVRVKESPKDSNSNSRSLALFLAQIDCGLHYKQLVHLLLFSLRCDCIILPLFFKMGMSLIPRRL